MKRSAVVSLLVLCGQAFAGPALPLSSDGSSIRDRDGRFVLLRGLSYSALEFGNVIGKPNGPDPSDFDQMASFGVNVVRLPIAWHYLEPSPNLWNEAFLRRNVDPIVGWAKARGMVVIIDIHQYLWSPCVGGIGAPDWSCPGYPPGTQGAFQAEHDFFVGALAPDGRPLVDHYVDAWRLVAAHFASEPAVAGFDLFNEPFDQANVAGFEHDTLYPLYRRLATAIRGTGASQILILEPPLTRNIGLPAKPEQVGDGNILYAPHLYTTTFGLAGLGYTGDRAAVAADYAQAASEAALQQAPLFAGEYGGETATFLTETELFLLHSLNEQDARIAGGAAWAYFPGDNGFSIVDAAGNEKGRLADALVEPYPTQVAGRPRHLSFAPHDGSFLMIFDEEAAIPDPTLLFIPLARHYQQGLVVSTSPGDRIILDPNNNRLLIDRDPALPQHWLELRRQTPLSLAPIGLEPARSGRAYRAFLSASGGAPPYRYAMTDGSLPPGITLSNSGGISGIPAGAGLFRFTVGTTDAASASLSTRYTLEVDEATCPSIGLQPSAFAPGSAGSLYLGNLTASGGTAPYRFSVDGGRLPPGLTLAEDGVVSGIPLRTGRYRFSILCFDTAGCRARSDMELGVGTDDLAGAGPGPSNAARVRSFRSDGTPSTANFIAFSSRFGVNVSHVSLDNTERILASPGPARDNAPHIRAFSAIGVPYPKVSFFAYGTTGYGARVSGGSTAGTLPNEILTAPGPGPTFAPHVRIFRGTPPLPAASFYAYQTLREGAHVATGELLTMASDEILTAPGPGPTFAPHIRAFHRTGGLVLPIPGLTFQPYPTLGYGAEVAAGPFRDSAAIIAAPGPDPAAPPRFRGYTFDGTAVSPLPGFDTTLASGRYGGRGALFDADGDGNPELLAGRGPDPSSATTLVTFTYIGSKIIPSLSPFDAFPGAGFGVDAAALSAP